MFYQNLKFPKVKGRPFFYTNFVQTIDGKTQVKKAGYWPIGSKKDYEVLVELRAYADCLIHGANLAREFGEITLKSISKTTFKQMRRVLGKGKTLPYYIITSDQESLKYIKANIHTGSLKSLVKELSERGYKNVLVEGGPTLLGSFLKDNLIDEIFLTISPKIYGNEKETTKNLVEGQLFPPDQIKHLRIISVKKVKDELFLRYSIES